jgi:hypothetical protein
MRVLQKEIFLCQEEVLPALRLGPENPLSNLSKGTHCSEEEISILWWNGTEGVVFGRDEWW